MSKIYPLIVLVLLLLLCACEEQPELAGGTSLVTEVLVFPTHDEPLPTDWGKGHISGELVQWNGCLHVNAEPSPVTQADSKLPYMLVWPAGFTLIEQSIHDRAGVVVASVGDNLRVSVRGVAGNSDLGKRIRQGIPDHCSARSYFIVGDDVSVIGKDEPVFLSVPGSPIKFQRKPTVPTSRGGGTVDTADDYYPRGELVLERDCLRIRYPEGVHPEIKYAIIWPAGFHPHVDEDGQVEVRNGGGRTVARVGDWLRFRGGESTVGDMSKCKRITGTVHRTSQSVGEYVCKYGRATHYTCGYIDTKNYRPDPDNIPGPSPTFIRVDNTAGYGDLSDSGDSGGPWFNTNDAYGTHVGSPAGDSNDAFYMAVNYISRGIHVDVLTSP